jgi:hypothetical protein
MEHAKKPRTTRMRAIFFTENSVQGIVFRANLLLERAEEDGRLFLCHVPKLEQNVWF